MKKLFLLIFFSQIAYQLVGVPAYPYPIVFTQPNGDTLTLTMKGDEFVSYAVTPDGYTLLYNDEGYFTYAQLDSDENLVFSNHIAKSIERRTRADRHFLGTISQGLHFSESQQAEIQSVRNMMNHLRSEAKAFPTTGNRKLICILMETPDRPFTKTAEDFQNLFNRIGYNTGGATGSVKDFFLECSYNQLNLTVDVVGPFTASHNMAYYAGSGGDSRDLLAEGIAEANPTVDFSQYDNDNDGVVDGIYMIFSGHGEEAGGGSDCIWSHAWSIGYTTCDGVILSSFACSPECRGADGTSITNIGVICHEFGHTLGAPDYYDTDYESNGSFEGTGTWDLQASGSWNNNGKTPAHPNPRSKVYTYEWATATTISSPRQITLPPSQDYKNAFYRINTNTPNEYYIVENRKLEGFDNAIPHHGMLIYHANSSISGAVNASHPQQFYIVAANSNQELPTGEGTYGSVEATSCPWPGSLNKVQFTDSTHPSMKSWNGNNTGKSITEISEVNDIIYFNFMNADGNSNYDVFLPSICGISISPANGSTSPVYVGGSFHFTYQLDNLYSHSSPVFMANGDTLTPNNGIYTISNITENIVVTVDGVHINTFPVTAFADDKYEITPAGTSLVGEGQSISFRILPTVGYDIDEVFVDSVSVGYLYDYTIYNVNEPHTIYATTTEGSPENMSVSPEGLTFSTPAGTTSEVQSVIVAEIDNNLTINILARAPSNYQISVNQESWKSSLVLYRENLPQELFIRFRPTTEGVTYDSISLASIASLNFLYLHGNATTDIDSYTNDDLTIYPNPTQDVINITYTSNNVPLDMTIYDIYGRLMIEKKQCSSNCIIDLTNYPSGVYLLQINNNGLLSTQKIIKK